MELAARIVVKKIKKLNPPFKGEKRRWIYCPDCKIYSFYDYLPYSLSKRIYVPPCKHDLKYWIEVNEREGMTGFYFNGIGKT